MRDNKIVILPKPKEYPSLPAGPVFAFCVGDRVYELRLPNTAKTAGKMIAMPGRVAWAEKPADK
jgi:hypothetical protein